MDLDLSSEQKLAGLRAMKIVAAANGDFAAEERALLLACADALDVAIDPDALAPIEPADLVRLFPDATQRQRLVQAMVVTSLIDGEASKDEVAVIERFGRELGVDEPSIENLHQVIDGHIGRLRFDFLRRVPLPRKLVKELWETQGLKGIWRLIQMARKKGTDEPELAWKYKQGLLPPGTLGYEFWRHMTSRKFAFPGEPGGLLEQQCHHDLTHVLTGYDTDPQGETQVACFYAGYYQEEPFAMVFMVLLMFHLGVRLGPDITTPARMQFDPKKALRAIERGHAVKKDLTDHWDFWPDLALPVDEVRAKYGVIAP